jgi:hypothetical protein
MLTQTVAAQVHDEGRGKYLQMAVDGKTRAIGV